jgi:hypothetical protein
LFFSGAGLSLALLQSVGHLLRGISVGLDAVVYRKREHLQLGPDEEHATLIRETGEVYFEDPKLDRKYLHKRKAVTHHLGNITAISILSDELSKLIGPESFLERTVLYSGTHSGDFIPIRDLDQFSTELRRVRETGRSSPLMREFVSALEELIQAAKEEGNPIVFE